MIPEQVYLNSGSGRICVPKSSQVQLQLGFKISNPVQSYFYSYLSPPGRRFVGWLVLSFVCSLWFPKNYKSDFCEIWHKCTTSVPNFTVYIECLRSKRLYWKSSIIARLWFKIFSTIMAMTGSGYQSKSVCLARNMTFNKIQEWMFALTEGFLVIHVVREFVTCGLKIHKFLYIVNKIWCLHRTTVTASF